MSLKIIAAMAEDQVIGKDNQMPWHIPEDLAYFKQQTMRQVVIMGRNTLLSMGGALPGRTNVVLSREFAFKHDGVKVLHSLAAAAAQFPDAFIIGGAKVFAQALPIVDTLLITHIHAAIEGDTHFPAIDFRHWDKRTIATIESSNGYKLSFCEYTRKHKPPIQT